MNEYHLVFESIYFFCVGSRALTPPDYFRDWHVGVRASKNGKLIASITGVPADVKVSYARCPSLGSD
jgi:hypothetical protein